MLLEFPALMGVCDFHLTKNELVWPTTRFMTAGRTQLATHPLYRVNNFKHRRHKSIVPCSLADLTAAMT
jgi:hypothetical protein